MTITNKNILRGFLILSYVAIIAAILLGLGNIYSYLNTGANRSTMLHLKPKQDNQYVPEVTFSPLNNKGRALDAQNLKAIETDYLYAWYVKHTAYKTNTPQGIADYYTEHARQSILDVIKMNQKENIWLDSTTLKHNISIGFFSEDGKLVSLTDTDVLEYKRIYKDGILVYETKEQATYNVILLLEDGFWRIRHITKNASKPFNTTKTHTTKPNLNVKGINYYPQATPWDMYGANFNAKVIDSDFKLIKHTGLNCIRIFVPYTDFGKETIKQDRLKKLITVLNLAKQNQLKVMVTLFDFYGDYAVVNWTLNQKHAKTLVAALKNHEALWAWDIKNEPDLDFKSRGKEKVIAWLEHILYTVKSNDTLHPVTIGWSNAKSGVLLHDKVDMVTFHYYENLDLLGNTYNELKNQVSSKPLVLTEFGISSNRGFWHPFGNTKKDQAKYHKQAQHIFEKHNIPFMSWTLYDFNNIPKEVAGRLPWVKQTQANYGFIDKKGETKPAFQHIAKK